MTQPRFVAMSVLVVLATFAPTAVSYSQVNQPEDSSPLTMTECEGVDNCATWTFLGVQGNGQWRSGEVANLYFQKVKVNDDKSVTVVIRRADSTGSAAGLTAVYTGTWRDGRVGGEFTSSWPGHWKDKSGNWYAITEVPLSLPSVMHLCAHDHCLTYTWEDGHYTNYTNLPYQSGEKRVLTVRSFTRESIVFHDTEYGSYPLTAVWTGRISSENSNMADGTVLITSWGGKPIQNPAPAPFKLAWGAALDLIPGSDAEPERRVQQPLLNTGEGALNLLHWLQFFKGVADLLAQAEPVKDVPGWKDTRWGMSLAQIRQIHPEVTIGVDRYGGTVARLPDLKTASGTIVNISLLFKGVGRERKPDHLDLPQAEWRLHRVELSAVFVDCSPFIDTLTANYGQPTRTKKYGQLAIESGEPNYYIWELPSTTVSLMIGPNIISFEPRVEVDGNRCSMYYTPADYPN